ncbi:FkbM family methyltransferase [Methylocystis sp.]|jgi:FkbM family methyltransferase|uniref:FkbM family methyltransferase n=1 Tax=Methylocystis sp. TaxID=1911079 RepID=UPI003DA55B37
MERLRRALRGVLGYNSPIYRAASHFTNFANVVGAEGPAAWRILRKLASSCGPGDAVALKLRKLDHPILLRPGTEDASTIIHTVVREEYGNLKPAREPEVMIDAGAYIGDTSAYFLSRFKNLRIVAVEPSRESYEAARANLTAYGDRVILLNKGLAARAGRLKFAGNTTGASLGEDGEEIDCTSVLELMATFGLARVDILKMDIEGAETGIFRTDVEQWLPRVENVLIELHGPEAEQVVLGTLRAAGFVIRQHRSVHYCSRER